MEQIVYNNDWFNVLALKSKEDADNLYYGVKPSDYVTCVAFDAFGNVLLVSQYRPVISKFSLETPGGTIDAGQSPLEAIDNELKEELGMSFREFKLIATLDPDPGRLMNRLYVFSARDPFKTDLEPEKGIEIKKYAISDLEDLISSGSLTSAYSIAALTIAFNKLSHPFEKK